MRLFHPSDPAEQISKAVLDRAVPRVHSPVVDEIVRRERGPLSSGLERMLRDFVRRTLDPCNERSAQQLVEPLFYAASRGVAIGRGLLATDELRAQLPVTDAEAVDPKCLAERADLIEWFAIPISYGSKDLIRAVEDHADAISAGSRHRYRNRLLSHYSLDYGIRVAFVECDELLLASPELLASPHPTEGESDEGEPRGPFPCPPMH